MGKDQSKKDKSEKSNDRAKMFKKAVLAGVGATSSVERVKAALSEAMEDLVKVGQDLLDELEDTGKGKTENFQQFLRNLQDEAGKRTHDAEKKLSKLSGSTKKAVKEFGIATKDDIEEILERLEALEEAVHGSSEEHAGEDGEDGEGSEGGAKKRGRKKANNNNN